MIFFEHKSDPISLFYEHLMPCRRPNGYVTIRGNENELQKYKAMVEQERKEKENALRR